MALGATPNSRGEDPRLPIDGHPGGTPPKLTNSSELGQELLSSEPNEGLIHA
jgi:hypothetical protein